MQTRRGIDSGDNTHLGINSQANTHLGIDSGDNTHLGINSQANKQSRLKTTEDAGDLSSSHLQMTSDMSLGIDSEVDGRIFCLVDNDDLNSVRFQWTWFISLGIYS